MLLNVFFGIFTISSQIIVYLGSQDTLDSIDFSAVAIQKHPIDPLKHNFHLPSTLLTGFTVLLSVPTVVSAAVQNGLAVVPKNRINNPIIHSFLATDLLNAYFNRNLVFPILPTRISPNVPILPAIKELGELGVSVIFPTLNPYICKPFNSGIPISFHNLTKMVALGGGFIFVSHTFFQGERANEKDQIWSKYLHETAQKSFSWCKKNPRKLVTLIGGTGILVVSGYWVGEKIIQSHHQKLLISTLQNTIETLLTKQELLMGENTGFAKQIAKLTEQLQTATNLAKMQTAAKAARVGRELAQKAKLAKDLLS
jgi:hypothetical protein